MCCVLFLQLSSIISLNMINRMFFVRQTHCVFSELRTGILSIIYVKSYKCYFIQKDEREWYSGREGGDG